MDVTDEELIVLAFRMGGVTPAQLRDCTLRDLHGLWACCDARDEAAKESARR